MKYSVKDCHIVDLNKHHSQRKGNICVVENGNEDRGVFDGLIGREPLSARHTLPSSSDYSAVFRGSGINDLTFQMSAKHTFHFFIPTKVNR